MILWVRIVLTVVCLSAWLPFMRVLINCFVLDIHNVNQRLVVCQMSKGQQELTSDLS